VPEFLLQGLHICAIEAGLSEEESPTVMNKLQLWQQAQVLAALYAAVTCYCCCCHLVSVAAAALFF